MREVCDLCNGSGMAPYWVGVSSTCPNCGGRGNYVPRMATEYRDWRVEDDPELAAENAALKEYQDAHERMLQDAWDRNEHYYDGD